MMEPGLQGNTARRVRWQTYLAALIITAAVFATALYASAYFNDQRIEGIRTTQNNISIDILSLETQFDLLAEHSCEDIAENSVLSSELRPLGTRLAYMESQNGIDESELLSLKRYYSLLQIKDLLLMKRVSEKCSLEPVFILYFYSNEGDCTECAQQGFVLTELSEEYPQLRIYSFDYHLDLSALRTLVYINDIPADLPALVINDDLYTSFHSVEEIEDLIPNIEDFATVNETATSTESE